MTGTPKDPMTEAARVSPDEARVLRQAASNLRAMANDPLTKELDAQNLRYQGFVLDRLTDDYPADWPAVRGSGPDWAFPTTQGPADV